MKLEQILEVIDKEPELPIKSKIDYLAVLYLWLAGIFYPLKSRRAIVIATKRSIREHMIEAHNKRQIQLIDSFLNLPGTDSRILEFTSDRTENKRQIKLIDSFLDPHILLFAILMIVTFILTISRMEEFGFCPR